LAKLDFLMRFTKSRKLKYASFFILKTGSYIRERKYQEIILATKARLKINRNPFKISCLNTCRISPAKKELRIVIIERALLRQPKYLPRRVFGIWSDISEDQAGIEKALKQVNKVIKSIKK